MSTTINPSADIVAYAKKRPVTLWQGPSEIDGLWTRAIGAWTGNRKTGKGYGISFYTSTFGSGCGSCRDHCYVLADGRHAKIHYDRIASDHPVLPRPKWSEVFDGEYIRLGIFGDPASAPFHVLQRIASHGRNWTGYTHHWRNVDVATYGSLLNASLDHSSEVAEAEALGWNYFLPLTVGKLSDHKTRPHIVSRTIRNFMSKVDSLGKSAVCPNFTSQGNVQCSTCKIGCRGTSGFHSITIPTHGIRTPRAKTDVLPIID